MSKKIIIELNNDCLLQEYNVDRFDKNICLQLNDDCNCEIYGDNVVARRVDKKDIKTFVKAHKDLIGKNVNFVLYDIFLKLVAELIAGIILYSLIISLYYLFDYNIKLGIIL